MTGGTDSKRRTNTADGDDKGRNGADSTDSARTAVKFDTITGKRTLKTPLRRLCTDVQADRPSGQRFTIDGEDIVDKAAADRCGRTKPVEHLSE